LTPARKWLTGCPPRPSHQTSGWVRMGPRAQRPTMLSRIFALFAILATTAFAQAAPEDACKSPNASHDERIAGCTAIINAKRETGRELALAYCNRGFALTEKHELDRARAYLEEAIKIDPTYACSFSNRGRVWQFKGELNR